MDFIPENPLLKFHSDTLQYVRKENGLDNPEKLKECIDSLFEWIQKQEHFVKKDYSKEFLERIIITCEGSLETAKKKLDLISTFKTALPKYFEPFDMDNSYMMKIVHCTFLPHLTEDHSRVFMLKNCGQRYDSGVLDFFKYLIMMNEYLSAHDYANGLTVIFDYTQNNVKELIKRMNFVELQQCMTIVLEGYNVKLNSIHFLTSSEFIDTYIGLVKKVISPKVGQLIQIHRNVESLYEYVPKDIMPIDYGGKEKPLRELCDNFLDVLKSEKFTSYFNKMKQAKTNEVLRKKDIYNDHYVGMPGSLKFLSID